LNETLANDIHHTSSTNPQFGWLVQTRWVS